MFDSKGRYIVENYAKKPTFASFLPGIAGEMGIPLWSFYVNRGQGICSFGSSDKEHSIMEFSPAHQSYREVSTRGFRTFLKVNGQYCEPFREAADSQRMYIGMAEMEIEEINHELGIQINVRYMNLPQEEVGGLVRTVTLKNLSGKQVHIDMLDGMPEVMTYGTSQGVMKAIGQTAKAWMQVEDVADRVPYYRVRFSMGDSTVVKPVEGGNFYVALDEGGNKLPVLVDSELVFGYDRSLNRPIGFCEGEMEALFSAEQVVQNNVLTAFFGRTIQLEAGASSTHHGLIGQTQSKPLIAGLLARCAKPGYFEEKYAEAVQIVAQICGDIKTQSADPVFDAYCAQTYLDNLLRGGYPIVLGEQTLYYLYSRKHGDIERDYNFFYMQPEYYSQGNANFRDINQNRRSDVLFNPHVGEKNIKKFYHLLQLDGYNPLLVEMEDFALDDAAKQALRLIIPKFGRIEAALEEPFTPGRLAGVLRRVLPDAPIRETMGIILDRAQRNQNASFGEGYWTDHWTYNLDLVESFLSIYPEDEQWLLFDDATYLTFEAQRVILPRSERYCKTENGIRQYRFLDEERKRAVTHRWVREGYGQGEVYRATLFSKMVVLAALKVAALDPHGMGLEMEGGRPGWYDALNGMPAIFGACVSETYELSRMISYMLGALRAFDRATKVPVEVSVLIDEMGAAIARYRKDGDLFMRWDAINAAKEAYRERTAFGIDGEQVTYTAAALTEILETWNALVQEGIARALSYDTVAPCYFAYEMTEYAELNGKIIPKAFAPVVIPKFLEGPTRYLKLAQADARAVYEGVKRSGLYDQPLRMYKVNESLAGASYEIGRAKAFTPGWLENESIWLHMEYKYLLELLRAGLYASFFADLKAACVPFLNVETYGRSPLENSSFIASSANTDRRIQGKGFVARLSGSTAEFVNMWQLMMFGAAPFAMRDGELIFAPRPALPQYLLQEGKLSCRLLGKIALTYTAPAGLDLVPGTYTVRSIALYDGNGNCRIIQDDHVAGAQAVAIRSGKIARIDIEIE